MDRAYTTAIWTVRLHIVSGIASCDMSVCLSVCPHTTNRAPLPGFIVKFCTGSLLTQPKFVLKWTAVLLLLKCANFDIGQEQRTVLLSSCVQCHTDAVLSVRSLPKYFSERLLLDTEVRGQWQARSYAVRISVRHNECQNNYLSKVQWSLYVPPCSTWGNSAVCSHSVFMCFAWIWEQTTIISLYSINWLVFIAEI